ncbi:DUF427 domain-containing protein [Ktedonobacteria bacterium brp13]|nr:DUF427 domain-containing protein [Ktedonobacteria bacterium brp13]
MKLPRRIEPAANQESVWDYPRPPRLEDSHKLVQVIFNGVTIIHTNRAKRVLETSQPPAYYISPADIKMEYFIPSGKQTFCEWKGEASYYTIRVGDKSAHDAAWYYPHPTSGYREITNYIAIYPSLMDACYVNGEKVQAQEGDFYGGWITSDIVGPFKGGPGTYGW